MTVALSWLALMAPVLMYFRLYHGFLLYLMVRPILDWGYNVAFAGVSLVAVGSIIPIPIVLARPNCWNLPWRLSYRPYVNTIYLVFFIYSIVHLIVIDIENGDFFNGIDGVVRFGCGIVGAILFLRVITSEERYQKLLKSLLIMGAIPAIMLILQHMDIIQDARSRMYGSAERLTAFAHGSVRLRQYFSYAILSSISLIFMEPTKEKKIKYYCSIALALSGMSFLYSKSAVLFIGVVPVLAMITIWNRNKWSFLIVVIFLILLSFGTVLQYAESVFFKEISSYVTLSGGGAINEIRALNGRLYAWELTLNNIFSASTFDFIIGAYDHLRIGFSGGTHNDFLMNFGRFGLLGLILYSFMLAVIVIFAFVVCRVKFFNSPQAKSRLFVFRGLVAMWCIDSVGMHVSMVPMFLMVMMGFMAMVNRDLQEKMSRAKKSTLFSSRKRYKIVL